MDKNLALETLKSFIENTDNVIAKDAILALHPELKGSEDERIKKALINLISNDKAAGYTGFYKEAGITCDDAIAYLEKQKEPEWCHHKVDLSDCSEEYRKAYYDGWNNCNQQHSQLQAEQKPAEWTEEDKKVMDNIIFSAEHHCYLNPEETQWLKSIRPQPHWKPSKKQMDALKHCVNGWQDTADGTLESLYNDLKKLI